MNHRKILIADESEINAYIAADDDWENRLAGFSFLDTASVKEYYLGDASFFIQVLHEYVKSDILVRLERQFFDDRSEDARSVIRRIGEEAKLVGAAGLADKAWDAEQLFFEGDEEEYAGSLKKLLAAYKRIVKRIEINLS